MAYTIIIKPAAERQIRRCGPEVQRRLKPAIDALSADPRPPGCKKLAREEDLYRVRVGDYRIIYAVQDRILVVEVVKVGHRSWVYS